jgi:RNA polymerase sigma factor (sigma-70 family)
MTNEEYKQWLPLVKKVALKYKNNVFNIEVEDLEQIASIGLLNGFCNFAESKGASLKTYLYNQCERAILREFLDLRRIKRKANYECISLNTPIGEDEEMFLEEIIKDDRVEIQGSIEEKIILEAYKKEVDICLMGIKREIVCENLFMDMNFSQIALKHNLSPDKVRRIAKESYKTLVMKSKVIREKWLELKEDRLEKNIMAAYNNPEKATLQIEKNHRLKEKYKHKIDVIEFIQDLLDRAFISFLVDDKIKSFLNQELSILNFKDLYLLNEFVFNKVSLNKLIDEGYLVEDILSVEKRAKNVIITNKEHLFYKWQKQT